jgi:hypothetical protein
MSKYIGSSAVNLSTTSADVTGNADIDGNLTVGGNLTVSGTTITVDHATAQTVDLGDGDKIRLGDDNDLQIYHDGTHSRIKDLGTGSLVIGADEFIVQNAAGTENKLIATTDGAVSMSYNGGTKLATTSTGVDITGTITSDGLSVGGNILRDVDNNSMFISGGNAIQSGANIALYGSTSGNSNDILLRRDNVKFAAFDGATGDISFYEDTGTTPKFFWDASAERLGIGTSSPDDKLHVTDNIRIEAAFPTLRFKETDTTDQNYQIRLETGSLRFQTNNDAFAAASEAMRLDASGNLLVGKTSTNYNVTGVQAFGTGYLHATADISSGGQVVNINRKTSDGELINFRKDGTTAGSIGTSGGDLFIGTGDTGVRFVDSLDCLLPLNTSTNATRDAGIDIGYNDGGRFKDLYLSGGVNIYNSSTDAVDIRGTGSRCEIDNPANNAVLLKTGGTTRVRIDANGLLFGSDTAAANALDDYEEGTFNPSIGFRVSTTGSLSYTRNTFRYIKVGSSVFITGFLTWYQNNFTANSGAMQLQGLPFAFANSQEFRGGVNIVYCDAIFTGVTIYQQGFRNEQAETNMVFNFSDATNGAMDSTITSYTSIPSGGSMMISGTYTTT